MEAEPSAATVAARLEELRRLCGPEAFDVQVQRAMAELRALCELARHLHANATSRPR